MLTQDQFPDVLGQPVYDPDGDKIGKVGQVFVDNSTGAASWLAVDSGLFGNKETFIPAHDAILDGKRLVVPYSKDLVKNAPTVDAADGQLSPSEEDDLHAYYGSSPAAPAQESAAPAQEPAVEPEAEAPRESAAQDSAGQESAGRDSASQEETMTLSEEQLSLEKERVESGTARVSKHVVTEEQTVTVPVSHEEARLEREPIDEADRDQATDAELGDDERSITLTEERIVVTKETVPVERVRLSAETVTEDQEVTETVRREQLETDPADLDSTAGAGNDER